MQLSNGNWSNSEDEIKEEIIGFYSKLLGTAAPQLPAINPAICALGNVLNRGQHISLIQPVTPDEVLEALKGIEDLKAPGGDGFNACFFKKAWQVVGKEVTEAVLQYFETGILYKPINCTSVTLIPKVKNPSSVREFRPISCCSVIYKLVSKILTSMLQSVV